MFTPVLEELSKSKINLFTRFIPQDPELLEIKYLNMLNVSPKNPEYIKMVKDVMKHNSNKQLLNLYSKIFQRIHNDDSDYDNIPLIEAIIADNLDFLKYIIEVCGANINATAYQGKTALILASENGNLSMVKYLIEQNADKSIKSYGSKDTALRLAFKKGYGEIVRYIIPTTQPNLVGNDLPKKETKFTRRRRSI